ncbi:Polyphosphate glucokinase [Kytococcus aerolatus]|uniref:Polyphosphate glucokinase n=1 Tax=Kytococcus aerolatus TaxID=592308 RepID=A0A212U2M0_9MICO|nr:ROK family protein [Kytococcus aerolatus]SNC72495.1 Polyphosphate glucokinase [Kytococcus aerolatus]
MSTSQHTLGLDVGGSGIKGAPVDLTAGAFSAERLREETPEVSTPQAVGEIIAGIADAFAEQTQGQPVGVTVPAVVSRGTVRTAANIDSSWIGTDADALFSDLLEREVHVLNDADAAGLAEAHFGAARSTRGLVLMTTLGTGIGTALLHDGVLIPNSELGHIEIDGKDAETRAANSVREAKDLDWDEWADRLQTYYSTLENLLWPELIVVGGGVSKKAEKFLPRLHLRAPIVPAQLLNDAGIIGAALAAQQAAAR